MVTAEHVLPLYFNWKEGGSNDTYAYVDQHPETQVEYVPVYLAED